MTVNVEQRHIDEGRPQACGRCPISLAVLDALSRAYPYAVGNVFNVSTYPLGGAVSISLTFKDCGAFRYLKPRDWLEGRHALDFMVWFDKRLPVLPFSFDVDFV